MTLYRYKVIDSDGHTSRGTLDAPSMFEVEARLINMGLDVISISEYKSIFPKVNRSKFQRRDLINFCFYMEQQMQAGVPIVDGLRDIRDTAESKSIKDVTSSLIEKIEGGLSLSKAMNDFPDVFDSIFVGLIAAGERSGQLPEILRSLTDALKWQDELSQQAKRALMYPLFASSVIVCVIAALMIYLVPELIKFITSMNGELPFHTKMLIMLSDAIREYGFYILSVSVALIFFLRVYAAKNEAFAMWIDKLKLRIWLIGNINKKLILSRMTHNFSLLYASGITVIDSLDTCEHLVGNRVMAKAINDAKINIAEGRKISDSFELTGLFPKLVISMLNVGETTGALDKSLMNINYFYQRDVRESLEKLESMIGPILTVVLGGVLAWVILSVLGPIYDVISTIKI